jgi:DNA polymerase III epsilon subunit-like protein
MNTVMIGGSEFFTDVELGWKQIDESITKHKINKKDLVVFGYAPKSLGAYLVAKTWAEKNNVKFINGNPNPQKYNDDWRTALDARNTYVAENCDLLINFTGFDSNKKLDNNGGIGIIEVFESKGKPIECVGLIKEKKPEPKKVETKKEIFIPPANLLKRSIAQFSKFVEGILPNIVSLDTETTGLSEVKDDIVEIAIVEAVTGKTLYDSLIFTETKVTPRAFEKNNITNEMLLGKPTLDVAYKKFAPKIKNKIIVASNSDFDEKMLNYGLLKLDIIPPSNIWVCLQKLYRNYSLQPKSEVSSLNTERIAHQMHVPIGTHRALSDVEAQNLILQAMAEGRMPDFSF